MKKDNMKKGYKGIFESKLKAFSFGFALGALPILIGYLYYDPIMSLWAIAGGLVVGFVSMLLKGLLSKNKLIGMILLILSAVLYAFFVLVFLTISFRGLY